MDGDENGVFCNLELKIGGNDNAPVGCSSAKELNVPQFKEGISPTAHLHVPFKKPRLVEETCSLSSGNKPRSKIMESPADRRPHFQLNNLTGDPGVAAGTRPVSSYQTSDENEDLDDSLLELEEEEDDEDDLTNFTSEEIDVILQDSNDDIDNNFDSLKCGDVNGIGAGAFGEHTHNLSSLFSPSTSHLPKSCLVINDLEASDQVDALMTNVSTLKVDEKINQSVKSEKHNQNSIYEITEIEKSEELYHITVDSIAVVIPLQGSADEHSDERDHTPSSSEADPETQDAVLSGSSSSILKEDDNSTLEQDISEEKAADGRVKDTDVPECGEEEVPEDPGKHQQSAGESSQEMEPRKCSPSETGRTHLATRQKTRLNPVFSKELEQEKQQYLKSVFHHVKGHYENQGLMEELHSLMDKEAARRYYTSWQSKSDLTVRNYMKRHRSQRKIDLREWAMRSGEAPRFLKFVQSLQHGPHS
ncbi:S100P-binding protein-like isoform X2 [Mobula hypostoma]|uniref:S100P-binding protein-like isoform X2 n=1 Tax=Mobula hypostoma TaxID=723540 RepID=UPI002FC2AF96